MREHRVRDEAQSPEAARVQECQFTSFPSNIRWRQLEHTVGQHSVSPSAHTTCSTAVSREHFASTYLGRPEKGAIYSFAEINSSSIPGGFLAFQLERQLACQLDPQTWIIPVMPKCMTGNLPSPERVIQNLEISFQIECVRRTAFPCVHILLSCVLRSPLPVPVSATPLSASTHKLVMTRTVVHDGIFVRLSFANGVPGASFGN